jgi:hypothetical protein
LERVAESVFIVAMLVMVAICGFPHLRRLDPDTRMINAATAFQD